MQTHVINWRKTIVLSIVFAASTTGVCNMLAAQNQQAAFPETASSDPVVKLTKKRSRLQIVERFSKIVELDVKITAVDGFDPDVIDVSALTPNRIRVQAVKPGVTTMSLFDENDDAYSVEVFVGGDVRHLQAHLDQMFPNSAVKAVAVKDSVVLTGWVTQPEKITQITEIAQTFTPTVLNQVKVGGAQQVQLKVQVMEVQRAKIRQFGLNFGYETGSGYLASIPGQLAPLAGLGPPLAFGKFADATVLGGITSNNSTFRGFLEALKRESLLKILAEPVLVTTNGRPANMLAGGEFPVLVPQSLGTTTIEWREFGVRLEAVPTILGNGRVRLELAPEVSDQDFTNAVTTGGVRVPGLTTRRVNTQVEMNFGETIVLAGLLSMRRTAETQKVPFLGELPWIGMAFRRVRYDEGETELVIMVTPELVAPMKPCEVPPGGPGLFTDSPTARELYIHGMIEIPKYGDECEDCNNYYPGAGYSSEPTLAPSAEEGGSPVETVPPAPAVSLPSSDGSYIRTVSGFSGTKAADHTEFNVTIPQPKTTRSKGWLQGAKRFNPFRKAKPAQHYPSQPPQNRTVSPTRTLQGSAAGASIGKPSLGTGSTGSKGPASIDPNTGLIVPTSAVR